MYNDYQRVHYITIVTEVNLNVLKSNLINCGLVLASIYEKNNKIPDTFWKLPVQFD